MDSIRENPVPLRSTGPVTAVPGPLPNGSAENGEPSASQPGKKNRGRPPKQSVEGTGADSQGEAAPKPKRYRRKDGDPPPPQGRPPKLDENGNRINPPKKRPSQPGVNGTPTDSPIGATVTANILSSVASGSQFDPASAQDPEAIPLPSALTQPGDFLRHLQPQQRSTQPSSSPTSLPTSINPALLQRVPPPVTPVAGSSSAPGTAAGPSTTTSTTVTPVTTTEQDVSPSQPAGSTQPDPLNLTGQPREKNRKHVEAAKRRWEQRKEKLASMTEEERAAYNAAVAQARLEKSKAKLGTPNSKANSSLASISRSASSKTTINLSGSKVSRARMRELDAASPTKIIGIKRKYNERPKVESPIKFVAPETLMAALAHVTDLSTATLGSLMDDFPIASASQPITTSSKGKAPMRPSSQPRMWTPDVEATEAPIPSSSTKRRSEMFVEMISRRKFQPITAIPTARRTSTPSKRPMATRSAGPIRETRSSRPAKQFAIRSGPLDRRLARQSPPVQPITTRSAEQIEQTPTRSPPLAKRPKVTSALLTRAQFRPTSSALRPRQASSPLTPSTRPNRSTTVHHPSPLPHNVSFPKHVKVQKPAREDSVEYVGTAIKGKEPVVEIISSQRSSHNDRSVRRGPVDGAKVVIRINRKRRDKLIQRSHYGQ